MPQREPMTKTMKFTDARQQFSQVVNQVFKREARVIVEKSGLPVAAIISAQDLEQLRRLEAERDREFAILDEIGEAFRDVPAEEVQKQVNQGVLAARKQLRENARRSRSRDSTP